MLALDQVIYKLYLGKSITLNIFALLGETNVSWLACLAFAKLLAVVRCCCCCVAVSVQNVA